MFALILKMLQMIAAFTIMKALEVASMKNICFPKHRQAILIITHLLITAMKVDKLLLEVRMSSTFTVLCFTRIYQ